MNDIKLVVKCANGSEQDISTHTIDGITLESVRKGAPAVLKFSVIKGPLMNFTEGANCKLTVNGTGVFSGYIFTKERNKEQIITCTAYDQLRYLKNKDTYVYTNKSASDVIRMVAKDFGLELGEIADTGYKIPLRDEDNQTLFDIILNALDLTQDATGKVFVLYDDFGKITLKNIEDMKHTAMIDSETAENFNYSTSIDKDTYNRVLIQQENDKEGKRDMYVAQDGGNVQKWGYLQYFMSVQKGVNAQSLANTILKAKNRKTSSLQIKGFHWSKDLIRAGNSLPVSMDLGDNVLSNEMLLCERVTTTFKADTITLDIEFFNLKGQ